MGQHDEDQVNEHTKLETVAPAYVDNKFAMSRHETRFGLSWDYRAGVRTERMGLRLQASYEGG